MLLELRNPHSILAALKMRPHDVLEVRIPGHPQRVHGAWRDVVRLANEQERPIQVLKSVRTGRRREAQSAERSGSASALIKPRAPVAPTRLFESVGKPDAAESATGSIGLREGPSASERQDFGLWLALERLQDPRNIGAIFRTAAFFAVRGIVITREQTAPLSATVYDVAAGGVEYVPFSRPANLRQAFEAAQAAGIWILAASEHAPTDLAEIPRDRPWLLVLGSEERGLRRLTLERCDALCRLTARGPISSLNVSVAAALFMQALSAGPATH